MTIAFTARVRRVMIGVMTGGTVAFAASSARADDDLLAGPDVPPAAHAARAERPRIPVARFLEIVRAELTQPAQRAAVAEIERAFRAEQRAFREAHRATLRALDARIAALPAESAERRAAVLERRTLRATAPNVIDALESIWRELTPAQQQAARRALDAERAALRAAAGDELPERASMVEPAPMMAPAARPPWRDPATPVGRRVRTLLDHRRPVRGS